MSEQKIEVTKMVVEIGKREITLTVEEAKKLQAALNEIFKVREVVREEHHYHGYQWGKWYWPYYSQEKVDISQVYGAAGVISTQVSLCPDNQTAKLSIE